MDTPRQSLSEYASFILERMDPDRAYGREDLQRLLPDVSLDRLREVMHELWIARQVERVAYSGWQRTRSELPHRSVTVSGARERVKPEDLFDHARFADFFKEP